MNDFQKEILSLLNAALHETEPVGVRVEDIPRQKRIGRNQHFSIKKLPHTIWEEKQDIIA